MSGEVDYVGELPDSLCPEEDSVGEEIDRMAEELRSEVADLLATADRDCPARIRRLQSRLGDFELAVAKQSSSDPRAHRWASAAKRFRSEISTLSATMRTDDPG